MNNHDLFDDLELEEITEPTPSTTEKELKQNIQKAAKEVMEEIKPDLIQNLDDLFQEEPRDLLDDEDYLKKTIVESLSSAGSCNIQGTEVSIMKQEDGKFCVYGTKKGKKGNDLLFKDLTEEQEAVDKAVDHVLKIVLKRKPSLAAPSPKKEIPEKEPYTSPRIVRVWGRDLFTEEDPSVTEDQIIEKISRDYGFPEFRTGRVTFNLDEETGILNVGLMFNKKG